MVDTIQDVVNEPTVQQVATDFEGTLKTLMQGVEKASHSVPTTKPVSAPATTPLAVRNRVKRTVALRLPSHTTDNPFVVEVRSVGFDTFLRNGKIPNLLLPTIEGIFTGVTAPPLKLNTLKEMQEFMQYLYDVATAMIASHEVVPEVTDWSEESKQIPYEAFTLSDLFFLVNRLGEPLEALATFPKE